MQWVKIESEDKKPLSDTDKQVRNKKTGRMATGVDPYSQTTLDTTPTGRDPGPKQAGLKKTRYSHIDFTIPAAVKAAAAKGLELRQWNIENGRKSQPGGTGIGVARARWLKSEKEAHPRGIRRISSYLGRKPYDSKKDKNGKWAPSYVAWLLWGGHPAKSWADSIAKKMEAADKKAGVEESIMRESDASVADLKKAADAASSVVKRSVKGLKRMKDMSLGGDEVYYYFRASRPDGVEADVAKIAKSSSLVRKMKSMGLSLSKTSSKPDYFDRYTSLFTGGGMLVMVSAVLQNKGAFVDGKAGIGVHVRAAVLNDASKKEIKRYFGESAMNSPVASELIAALHESVMLDEASALPVFMRIVKDAGPRGARFDVGFTRAIKRAGLKISDEDIVDLVNTFVNQGKLDIKRKAGAKFIHVRESGLEEAKIGVWFRDKDTVNKKYPGGFYGSYSTSDMSWGVFHDRDLDKELVGGKAGGDRDAKSKLDRAVRRLRGDS